MSKAINCSLICAVTVQPWISQYFRPLGKDLTLLEKFRLENCLSVWWYREMRRTCTKRLPITIKTNCIPFQLEPPHLLTTFILFFVSDSKLLVYIPPSSQSHTSTALHPTALCDLAPHLAIRPLKLVWKELVSSSWEDVISGTMRRRQRALGPPWGLPAPEWEPCGLPAVLCNMLNSRGSPCVCLKPTGVPLKPWLPSFRTAMGTQRTALGSGTLQGTPIIEARTQASLFVLRDMSTRWTTPSVKPIDQSVQRGILIGVGQTDFVTKLQRKLSSWMFTLSNPWPEL